MNVKLMDQVRDTVEVGAKQVFGTPYEKNGVTIIPVARVMGGGGEGTIPGQEPSSGGAMGIDARPAGAFVMKGDDVKWQPAIDVNRLVLGAQIIAVIALLSWRSVAMRAGKRR